MKLFRAFCKHLCPSESCPYKRELLGINNALPAKKEEGKVEVPDKGINESYNKKELGYTFDDIVKRAFLMLDKRYENMLTESNQSIQVKLEYNLEEKYNDTRTWHSRKELWIYRYYDTNMSASETFRSRESEEELEKKWKELIFKLDYFDKKKVEEY